MIKLYELALTKEPVFFTIKNHIKLDPKIHSDLISESKNELHIINFTKGDIINPTNKLIGVFGYYGSRRYIWQDKFWGEMHVPSNDIKEMINRDRDILEITGDNLFQKKLGHSKLAKSSSLPAVITSSLPGLTKHDYPTAKGDSSCFTYNVISVIYPLKHKFTLSK